MDVHIRRGRPDPEELAALVAVLGALTCGERPPDPDRCAAAHRAWAAPSWAGDHAGRGSWTGLSE